MLVLTRKINQQIRLNDDITITVLRAKGNSIRIGIDAPRSVRVVRGELEPRGESELQTATLEFEATAEEGADEQDVATIGTPASTEPAVYPMQTAAPLSAFLRKPNTSSMASLAN